MTTSMHGPVLDVRHLSVAFGADPHAVRPVHDLSLALGRGECVALVGPSGSGKTTAALALIGLIPTPGRVVAGEIRLHGTPLPPADAPAWRSIRGRRVALVPQEPLAALTPALRVGTQVAEAARAVLDISDRDAQAVAADALRGVGLDDVNRRLQQYPHELSGGQRQRVLLAIALLGRPDVLIADEPTSALDVLTAHDMMRRLEAARRDGTALVLLSHDRALVAAHATHVVTMGATPQMPVTRGRTTPLRAGLDEPMAVRSSPVDAERAALSANGISVRYDTRPASTSVLAVDDVSFSVAAGECLAIVGASGAGKSSLVRAVLRLGPMATGVVRLGVQDFGALRGSPLRTARAALQPVFQDPGTSLHPWRTVRETLDEGLRVRGIGTADARRAEGNALLESVGLDPALADRHPHALSGGQRQRVAIARALTTDPRVLVCDEPVSALDDEVRAQVLDVLDTLRRTRGVAVVCVSHDLNLVRTIADRVLVMYAGRVIEHATPEQLFSAPQHPYTAAMVAVANGRAPDLAAAAADGLPAPGCIFFGRCSNPAKDARCRTDVPTLTLSSNGHAVACHHPPASPP